MARATTAHHWIGRCDSPENTLFWVTRVDSVSPKITMKRFPNHDDLNAAKKLLQVQCRLKVLGDTLQIVIVNNSMIYIYHELIMDDARRDMYSRF